MSGDGRGHATRVQTIVDRLKSDHEFLLLCAQDAYDLLTGIYHFDDRVTVEKIPGMSFGYSGNKVSYTKCFVKNGSYIWNVGQHVERVEKRIYNFGGEFAITDFEPSLPRAAHNLGIPYLSFDHQHTLSVSDFSALPLRLRWKAYFIAKVIPLYFTT